MFLEDRKLQADKVKLTRMAGFSNEIYKVVNGDKILILKKKVAEKKTLKFIYYEEVVKSIVKENQFGPATFYEDDHVIIEEFLPGEMITIAESHSLRYIFKSIDQVVKFNHLKISPSQKQKLNSKPMIFDMLQRGVLQDAVTNLKQCLDVCADPARRGQMASILSLLDDKNYLNKVVATATKHNKNLVFGHNDFYRLNLLKDAVTDKVALIDYEYAGMNPLGWDVVNLFCERCFCYDEEKNKFALDINIPRTAQRTVVFKYYLLKANQLLIPDFPVTLDLDDEKILQDLSSDKYDKYIDMVLLTHLVEDFYEIMSVINYLWIIWCAVLVSETEERWPVVDYTIKRMNLQDYISDKVPADQQ